MQESLRDPAGLLERAPELAELAQADASVRNALAKGDPRGVHRALWWGRLVGRLKPQRATVDALLAHRRLFAAPFKRPPALGTMNGVGASLYGKSDGDFDGSYVKTHFLVFLFVPVFPFAQYLVRDAEGGGWYVMAKVPTSSWLRLWRGVFVGAVVVAMGAAAVRVLHASRHHDVHLVNGLPVNVRATVGAVTMDVPSGLRVTSSADVGRQAVVVTDASGAVLERGEIDVEAGPHLLAWNILGAAPLYESTVFYGEPPAGEAAAAVPRSLCGRHAVRVDGVHYAFSDPPQSISLPQGTTLARKKRFDLAPGKAASCVGVFLREGDAVGGLALSRDLARFETEGTASLAVVLAERLGAPDQAREIARREVARHPDSVEAHRLYQGAVRAQDGSKALLEEYRARFRASPDSPDAAYLYGRLLPVAEEFEWSATQIAKHPLHVPLLRLRLYSGMRRFRFEDALRHIERLRELDPKEWLPRVDDHALILAALARPDAAKVVLDEAFPRSDERQQYDLAGRYAWISGPDPLAETLFRKLRLADPVDALRFRVRFWTGPEGADLKPLGSDPSLAFYTLMSSARRDPSAARRAVASMAPAHLQDVDGEVLLLLLGEAVRVGDGSARTRLERAATLGGIPSQRVVDYLERGAWSEAIEELSLPQQGALHFSRARRPEVPAAERDRLRALAARCDPVGGFVTKALAVWPAP
jgi:tetratricopeptide (TPR) repeat protein